MKTSQNKWKRLKMGQNRFLKKGMNMGQNSSKHVKAGENGSKEVQTGENSYKRVKIVTNGWGDGGRPQGVRIHNSKEDWPMDEELQQTNLLEWDIHNHISMDISDSSIISNDPEFFLQVCRVG